MPGHNATQEARYVRAFFLALAASFTFTSRPTSRRTATRIASARVQSFAAAHWSSNVNSGG